MDDKRSLLKHFLAALAYRTQKALRGASEEFGDFRAAEGVRTPSELVRHMTSVLGYARTFFIGGTYRPEPFASLSDEIERFHKTLELLGHELDTADSMPNNLSAERILQGPLSDVMTHAGQLAMLRRLAGIPVPPENFIYAKVNAERLGKDQAEPASPDKIWNEAPAGWIPPE